MKFLKQLSPFMSLKRHEEFFEKKSISGRKSRLKMEIIVKKFVVDKDVTAQI